MKTITQLRESFNTRQDIKWLRPLGKGHDTNEATYNVNGGRLDITFYKTLDDSRKIVTSIAFYMNDATYATGKGSQMQVMSLVIDAIKQYVMAEKPAIVTFTATKTERDRKIGRVKLYDALIRKLAPILGYDLVAKESKHNAITKQDDFKYELSRK